MKFAKKSDILLVVALIIICLLFWTIYLTNIDPLTSNDNNTADKYAEVYYKGKLVKRVSLNIDQDFTFSIDEKSSVVFKAYADGSVAFHSSDCPDHVCIKSGKLTRANEVAVCLPNSLVLKVVYDGDENTDDIDINIK